MLVCLVLETEFSRYAEYLVLWWNAILESKWMGSQSKTHPESNSPHSHPQDAIPSIDKAWLSSTQTAEQWNSTMTQGLKVNCSTTTQLPSLACWELHAQKLRTKQLTQIEESPCKVG